jgi:hypothetical protein
MVAGSHAPDQRVIGMRASVGSHTTVALGPIVDLSCTVQTTVGRCDLELYRGAFVILEIPEFHGVILVFPQGIDPVVRTLRHHVVCSEEFAQIDHKRECTVQAEEAFRAVTVRFPVLHHPQRSVLVMADVSIHYAPIILRSSCRLFQPDVPECELIRWQIYPVHCGCIWGPHYSRLRNHRRADLVGGEGL